MATINKKHTHGGILNSSMSTGLQNNLKDAIQDVGGQVPESACLWEYPEIIRKNLIAKTVSVLNIKGSDIIKVTGDDMNNYVISTEIDKSLLTRPNYAKPDENYSETASADEIFRDLFTNILPAVRGLHAADITMTNTVGIDVSDWHNTLFNAKGRKTGLQPNSKYLRIYLTCQAEPLFIYIDAVLNSTINGYNIIDSDTITFELNDDNMTLTAHISRIDENYINALK